MKTIGQNKEKRLNSEFYDKFCRDKESKRFYHSTQWSKIKGMKLSQDPLCECCSQAGRVTKADVVHHMIPIKKGTKRLDLDFLVSLCHACHNAIESEMEREKLSG